MLIREALQCELPELREFEQKVVEAERPFNSAIKSEGATYYDLDNLLKDDLSQLLVIEDKSQIIATGYC